MTGIYLTRGLTARWFTDTLTRTAHSLCEAGNAACSQRILMHWSTTDYWKSDTPPGVRHCPLCEAILAGELP